MRLVEVNSSATIKAFHKVPFVVYKSDPHWIPHLKQDIEKVFTPKDNKFFRHGEITRWVLMDGNNPIGRVAAFINRKTANTFDYPTGGMGFFDCINNKEAAYLLFDQCKAWLAKREMEAMEGPVNFGEKDKYWGLIIQNFEADPYYQQNYNPEYYKEFFESYGFKVYYEQYVFYRVITDKLPDLFVERSNRVYRDKNYSFEKIDPRRLEKYAEDFRIVYNRAWVTSHSNFAEMSKAKALIAMKSMKPILDPELVYFAYYNDRPIGFFIMVPNVNEIFKYVNGNLNWWGKLKFLYYRWRKVSKTCIGVAFGIDPDFQGKGVESSLFVQMRDLIQTTERYNHLYVAWVGDFNPKMIRLLEGLETEIFRTMATYMKLFDENAPYKRRAINKNR